MKIPILVVLTIGLALSACGSSDSTESITNENNEPIVQAQTLTDEELADQLKTALENIGGLANKVELPPIPDNELDSSTISGIDSNNNGTRDLVENISYQGLNMIGGIEVNMYEETIAVMNMFQPLDPPVPNSINEIDIYCAYKILPAGIKSQLPFALMKTAVLDTRARKTAYRASLQSSSVSLGEDQCD